MELEARTDRDIRSERDEVHRVCDVASRVVQADHFLDRRVVVHASGLLQGIGHPDDLPLDHVEVVAVPLRRALELIERLLESGDLFEAFAELSDHGGKREEPR